SWCALCLPGACGRTYRGGRDLAGHSRPWPHAPSGDESVSDVRIGLRELLRNRWGFTLKQKDGTVNGIGQRAGENELTFRVRLPGQRQVLGTNVRPPLKVVGADIIEEAIVHRRGSLCIRCSPPSLRTVGAHPNRWSVSRLRSAGW